MAKRLKTLIALIFLACTGCPGYRVHLGIHYEPPKYAKAMATDFAEIDIRDLMEPP